MLVSMQRMNTKKRLETELPDKTISELIFHQTKHQVSEWGNQFKPSEELTTACHTLTRIVCNRGIKNGVMLVGGVGNGKTTLMRGLQQSLCLLVRHDYLPLDTGLRIVSAKDISRMDEDRFRILCNTEYLGIDDLGIEPREEMVYGRITTPVIDLLEYRYNHQLFTVITSNLTNKQRMEKYGTRIDDRFKEMFEKVVFKNGSYRSP